MKEDLIILRSFEKRNKERERKEDIEWDNK